jgi:hypothetical protein
LITGANVAGNIGGSGVTTITGDKVRTSTIDSTNLSWDGATLYTVAGTRFDLNNGQIVSKNFRIDSSGNATFGGAVTGATISGGSITGTLFSSTNNYFRVDGSGNTFTNNIYATGTTTPTGSPSQLGLQIRADGDGGSTTGAIWILSAKLKETKIGNVDGSLNIRYREASGTIPEAVVLEPAKFVSGAWSQKRHLEINLADDTGSDTTQYNMYINSDLVMRGGALTGTGNDIWSDTPTPTDADPSNTAGVAMWRTINSKGTYVLARSSSTSSIRIKENVSTVTSEEALSLISNLIPKKFTYKREEKFDNDFSYKFKQLDYDYGFIAEDVKEKIPTLAIHDLTEEGMKKFKEQSFEENDIASEEYFNVVNYKRSAISSILVATVQNLLSRVEFLEAQLAAQ